MAVQEQRFQVDQKVFAVEASLQDGGGVDGDEGEGGIYEAVVKRTELRAVVPAGPDVPLPSADADAGASSAAPRPTHQWSYLVHYLGWNTRYDRWTGGADLRPDTPEMRQLAQRVREREAERERERRARQRKKRRRSDGGGGGDDGALSPTRGIGGVSGGASQSSPKPGSSSAAKRKRSSSTSSPGSGLSAATAAALRSLSSACTLPLTLKIVLLDDRAKITRLGHRTATGYDDWHDIGNDDNSGSSPPPPARRVHSLPSSFPIRLVIKQFWKWKKRQVRDAAVKEVGELTAKAAAASKEPMGEGRDEGGQVEPVVGGGKGGDQADGSSDHPPTANADGASSAAPAQVETSVERIKARVARTEAEWKAFLEGVRDLFDDALAPFLLYRQEREQYLVHVHQRKNDDEKKKHGGQGGGKEGDDKGDNGEDNPRPSDVYGAEHLLRLFVRLPTIVSGASSVLAPLIATGGRDGDLEGFAAKVGEMILYLQRNVEACFGARYREPRGEELMVEERERGARLAE